jgi:hypothetical protein
VLETEAGRQKYLEELRNGGPAHVDIGRIYQAEQAFEKVAILVSGRAYGEALDRVNEAIALYPDEPEYHVWKAWLEFLLAPDAQRKSQRAASERAIEAALQKSPKCVPGWLFLGRMAKITGDLAVAERSWKRGLSEGEGPRAGAEAPLPEEVIVPAPTSPGSAPSCPPRRCAGACAPRATTSPPPSRWARRASPPRCCASSTGRSSTTSSSR